MKKHIFANIFLIMILSIFLSGCSLLEGLFLTTDEVPSYSFSGYVYADGQPIEGATINCGQTAVSDEQGHYSFDGIKNAVSVSVAKDGYLFDSKPIVVSSADSKVNFNGYKFFDKRGVVKNGDEVVEGVQILVESASGTYPTVSNANGEFYMPNLAGHVKLTATKDKFSFFTQSFSISKEDEVVVLGKSDISGKINVDNTCGSKEFILTCDGVEVEINDDLSFCVPSVSFGSVLKLTSENYHVSSSNVVIESVDDITFDCYRYYDISGQVSCGNVGLNGVEISTGREVVTSENGRFEIKNYYGDATLSCSLDGYNFESVEVSYTSPSAQINATTSVELSVGLDVGSDYEGISVKVGNQTFDKCSRDGKFVLTNVQFGQTVEVLSSDYHVSKTLTIENRNALLVDLQKLYSVNIVAKCGDAFLNDVTLSVDNNSQVIGASGVTLNLFGSHTISFEKDGYVFLEDFEVNYYSNSVVAECFKLFDIMGTVRSGEKLINNAQIACGEDTCSSGVNGEFRVPNVYGEITLTVSKDGYNAKELSVNAENCNLDINLDYNVSGVIKCGNFAVADVKIETNGVTAYSDTKGKFTLQGLSGDNKLTFSKETYTFADANVSAEATLKISGTYTIIGNVSTKEGAVSGLEIILLSKTGDMVTTTTDSDGNYEFAHLSNEYTLCYGQTNISLRPTQYTVKVGGSYNFSNTGFSFGGTVRCGDTLLSDVTLKIGDISAKTDENGVYSFPLVTVSGPIMLSKEGYTFVDSGKNIDDSFDGKTDVDFSATYKVIVNVKSGKVALDGVDISVNGESVGTTKNGTLEVTGLSGAGNTIALNLNNYRFVGASSVDGYMVLDYMASFDVMASVFTGDISVSGVKCYVGGVLCESASTATGAIIPNVKLGDVITFEKLGYKIETKTITSYVESIKVSASYTISGYVSNCNKPIKDVEVSIVGGKTTYTNVDGNFSFEDVVGSVELSFSKSGFGFENIVVSSADKVNVLSKYSISGKVKLNSGAGIGGVEVYVDGEKVTTTTLTGSLAGAFTINGLDKQVKLTFKKTGYEFGDELDISEPTSDIEVYGTYEISGYVKSGSEAISHATVFVGDISELTNQDGSFTISGLSGDNLEVGVRIDGYDCNAVYKRVSGYNSGVNFDLTYTVTLRINGDSSSVNITIAGESEKTQTAYTADAKNKTIKLTGLKGKNTITISKDGYIITPSEIANINSERSEDITVKLLYSISGTVKVKDGTVVPNAIIVVGDKEYQADSNGKYTITGLVGSHNLSAKLPFNGSNVSDITKAYGQINKAGTSYDIEFSNEAFYLGLLNNAYYNLDHLNSNNNGTRGYRIVGTGDVIAKSSGVTSESAVDVHYKGYANGIKVFENKNNGKPVTVLVNVDPNVSLLTVYDKNEGSIISKFIKGNSNVPNDNRNHVEYGNSDWDSWNNGSQIGSVEAYTSKFGIDMTTFSPYIIDLTTIKSATKVSDTGDNYVFKLDMNTTTSVTNYNILMGKMCTEKDMGSFSSIVLTVTISKTGYIKEMKMKELYTVVTNESSGLANMTANVDGDITYAFTIDENIGNFEYSIFDKDDKGKITSNVTPKYVGEEVRKVSTAQVTEINAPNRTTQKVDLIVCKKEEIL